MRFAAAALVATTFAASFAPPSLAQTCTPFTDVLASSAFCTNIQWLYNRGITLGCAAGKYCPADLVRRDQMAAFLNRLADSTEARTPYMRYATVNLDPPFVNNFMFFPTPAGTRLVLEHLSMNCVTPTASDQITQIFVSTRIANGSGGYHYASAPALRLVRVGPAPFSGWAWQGEVSLKLYADPDANTPGGGNAITLNIFHTEASQVVSCAATLTGYGTPL